MKDCILKKHVAQEGLPIETTTIYHKTEYRERRRHYAVFSVNAPLAGFDTDREAFTGAYRGPASPAAVLEGQSRSSIAHGWAPIGSHHLKNTLAPGESASRIFVLAYCENPKDQKFEAPGVINKAPAKAVLSRYRTDEQFDAAFEALCRYWEELLSVYHSDLQHEPVCQLL